MILFHFLMGKWQAYGIPRAKTWVTLSVLEKTDHNKKVLFAQGLCFRSFEHNYLEKWKKFPCKNPIIDDLYHMSSTFSCAKDLFISLPSYMRNSPSQDIFNLFQKYFYWLDLSRTILIVESRLGQVILM